MNPLDLLGGIGGAAIGYFGQQQTNEMQANMMREQQQFQERMSSTAYQRASEDMKKAGLNPMMMFSSGSAASTPAGASASPVVKSGLDAESVQKGVNTALQSRITDATINKLTEDIAKIKAETITEKVRPSLVAEQAREAHERGTTEDVKRWLLGNEAAKASYDIPVHRNRAIQARNEENIHPTARRLFDQGAYLGKKGSEVLSPATDVISSASRMKFLFPSFFH